MSEDNFYDQGGNVRFTVRRRVGTRARGRFVPVTRKDGTKYALSRLEVGGFVEESRRGDST
jgi:hypothetical protein